jgi:uncharacterized protein (TIGR00369 family)
MHQFTSLGLLHGGASVALAESVGSAASQFFINAKEQEVRGIEISANHLRSIHEGVVTDCTNYSQRKNAASVG